MNSIQLSIEELIFSFYSEGLYEQGMGLKDTYFPNIKEEDLKFMLEIASRSLLAKDMVKEEDKQYYLKEEYAEYIHVLNSADSTLKGSKFSFDLAHEESVTYHLKQGKVYSHQMLHDHQVHAIMEVEEESAVKDLNTFFQLISLESDKSGVLFSLTDAEFEGLLEVASQQINDPQNIVKNFSALQKNHDFAQLVTDLIKRKGKMDSFLYLKYDVNNSPDLVDITFFIPGQNCSWVLTRSQLQGLDVREADKSFIPGLLEKLITVSA
ncbi:hypothetical protein [Peribacillus frigoritolerans]|uniref:hypothetical protein n=1 Tax=Peribacillus frigoritolerans TaxID=450367 RepID=UPI001059FF29|nr:hypothetical protein [Peribacillus frigoritolerans]TDL77937.1 hypothetical protein E2R53_18800 [Peribacillus frigoritolerans]